MTDLAYRGSDSWANYVWGVFRVPGRAWLRFSARPGHRILRKHPERLGPLIVSLIRAARGRHLAKYIPLDIDTLESCKGWETCGK